MSGSLVLWRGLENMFSQKKKNEDRLDRLQGQLLYNTSRWQREGMSTELRQTKQLFTDRLCKAWPSVEPWPCSSGTHRPDKESAQITKLCIRMGSFHSVMWRGSIDKANKLVWFWTNRILFKEWQKESTLWIIDGIGNKTEVPSYSWKS